MVAEDTESRVYYIHSVLCPNFSHSSVQWLSCVQLFATPWMAACPAFLSFTISRSLPKLLSIELVMPSNRLILCHPLLLLPSIFPGIRVFARVSCLHQVVKVLELRFQLHPSNKYSGLISFRIDWFDLLAVKGLSRVFSNTTIQKHQFFSVQPSLWSNSQICT